MTSLWSESLEQFVSHTASADPTPGGGSVAAVTGAFGVALLQMSIAVTGGDDLHAQDATLRNLRTAVEAAADEDVAVFHALLEAYQLPKTDDAEREARSTAIEQSTQTATDAPLRLAEALVAAIAISHEIEPLVKRSIVSDVLAGRDLIRGAAQAAIRTADINLSALERRGAEAAVALRTRRDAASRAVDDRSPSVASDGRPIQEER